jgi:hypothetical protein
MPDVTLPDGSVATFPDDMPQEQIVQAIQTHLASVAPPAATPPATAGPAVGSMLSGAGNAAARAVTFGLSDLASAAGGATGAALKRYLPLPGTTPAPIGGTWSQDFSNQLAAERNAANQFSTQHPWISRAATLAGMLTPTAPIEAAGQALGRGAAAVAPAIPSLLRQTGTGFVGGAIGGGAEGASTSDWQSPGDVAKDIGVGAAAGGAAGAVLPTAGALAGRMISPLARAIAPSLAVPQQATRVIAGRLGSDVEAGGADVPALQAAVAGIPAGKPMGLVDVADPNVQALAGNVARQPGAGRTIALNAFGDRTSEAAGRIIDDINQGITPTTEFQARNQLLAQRQADAAPAYAKAYAAPALNPDAIEPGGELTNLMQRPSMQSAATRAQGIAQEEGRDPNSLGITADAEGNPTFQEVPSWQTLDYVKRGLDDHLDQWRSPLTGRLQLDENGRAALGTQQAFTSFLDDNNPDYAAARAAWSGPSAALSAMKQGQNFRSLAPADLQSTIDGMSPVEQEYFRVGAADTLRNGAAQTGDVRGLIGSNAATNRGASYLSDQLKPLFTDDDAFQRFTNRAQSEAQMLQTQARTIGGSPTAARMAEDQPSAPGAVGPLVTGIGGLMAGEPIMGGTQLATGLSRLARLPEINNPAVNAAIARRLYPGAPSAGFVPPSQTLRDVLALPPPAGQQFAAPAGALAARYGSVPATMGLAHLISRLPGYAQ